MKFQSNFLGYVDYLESEGWHAVDLNANVTSAALAISPNWVIYDSDNQERARGYTEDDVWNKVIKDERISSMDVGKLGDVSPADKSIPSLKYRVIELLRRQVEFAFESGSFYLKPDEHLAVDLTLSADTKTEIRRSYTVNVDIDE